MKRSIGSKQREVIHVDFMFDGVSNANTFSGIDKDVASLTTDSGAGAYIIDLGLPLQNCVVQATSMTTNIVVEIVSITAPTGGANAKVTVLCKDNDGTPTATDCKVAVSAKGSTVSDTYKP